MGVSIQQAGANALAAYLTSKLAGVVVEPRWPSPSKDLPAKAISIVPAGPRIDTPIAPQILQNTPTAPTDSTKTTTSVWAIAYVEQPLQMDIWTTTDVDRDDLLSQLDTILNVGPGGLASPPMTFNPVDHGVLIALADGWDASGTIGDFYFDAPDLDDTSEAVMRASYRATLSGRVTCQITATVLTPRQLKGLVGISYILDGDPTRLVAHT